VKLSIQVQDVKESLIQYSRAVRRGFLGACFGCAVCTHKTSSTMHAKYVSRLLVLECLEIREVYDSSIDSNIINTFKVQKGTKDIVKTVDVTAVVQP